MNCAQAGDPVKLAQVEASRGLGGDLALDEAAAAAG